MQELDAVATDLQDALDKKPSIRYFGYPIGRNYYEVVYDVYQVDWEVYSKPQVELELRREPFLLIDWFSTVFIDLDMYDILSF